MRVPAVCLWLMIGAAAFAAQYEVAPEVLLLARIKLHMEENLKRLPNYTCVQTIERSRRLARSHRFELVDTLRLEVALVGNKELFAWPGAGKFEDREIREMVPGGAIGNGNFGLHAYSVFLSIAPTFTYAGEMVRDGRKVIRYDYRVPYMSSGYQIRVPPHEAKVAYHGSLWVDAGTLDLVRLEVHADDIPAELGLAEASDSIDYGRVRIGDTDFLLPRSSELLMRDFQGNESRNRTLFTGCQQFTGQSVLSFGEAPPGGGPAPQKIFTEITLPPGLALELKLDAEIDSAESFVGDPVTARVGRNVKRGGEVLVPKGAVVSGRITRLEKQSAPYSHFAVGLQFFSLEFGNTRAAFTAELEEVGPFLLGVGATGRRTLVSDLLKGREGIFSVPGRERLRLPRGLRMVWRTGTDITQVKQ
jgi:hypothetical protein